MLDNLQLIHMNGRVYDPWLARFLSADPYIPDPTDTQSYNRYSYVQNNPLSFVDPSGFRDTVPNWYGDWTDWTTPWMWPNFPTYRPPAVVSPCGSNECKNDKPLPAFAPTSASPCDFMPCGGGIGSRLSLTEDAPDDTEVESVLDWICSRGISLCDHSIFNQTGGGNGNGNRSRDRRGLFTPYRSPRRPNIPPNSTNATTYIPGGSLRTNEAIPGAHVIEQHVERSNEWLVARMRREGKRRTSSFDSLAEAEQVVGDALANSPVHTWEAANGQPMVTVIRRLERPVGRVLEMRNGVPVSLTPTHVKIILRSNPMSDTGYMIETAYLESFPGRK